MLFNNHGSVQVKGGFWVLCNRTITGLVFMQEAFWAVERIQSHFEQSFKVRSSTILTAGGEYIIFLKFFGGARVRVERSG